MPLKRQPIALTLAGVDSSGGAGVAVDMATFNALGVHGKCVVTAVTAQSRKAVWGVQGTRPAIITAQLEAAFSERPPVVAKSGMLYSSGVVDAVAEFWDQRRTPLVVDPVLASSSGTTLLNPAGVQALKRRLLPLAKVVTPNVPEAEALSGMFIKSSQDMRFMKCMDAPWWSPAGICTEKKFWRCCMMAAMNTSLLPHDYVAVLGAVQDVGLLLRWLRNWLTETLCRPLLVRPLNG